MNKNPLFSFFKKNVGMRSNDKLLIINDKDVDSNVALELDKAAREFTDDINILTISLGQLLNTPIEHYLEFQIIITHTSLTLFHTELFNQIAKRGVRIISLTGASKENLISGAALADFEKLSPVALTFASILTHGSEVRILTEKGTNFSASIHGRTGNAETSLNHIKNPSVFPDIEFNSSIIEASGNGSIMVDLSISQIGVVEEIIELTIKDGRIVKISGYNSIEVENWLKSFKDPDIYQVAEIGFGLNPNARITGNIIEDESKLGTGHIGFGNNIFMGGMNKCSRHIDFVYDKPQLFVDDNLILDGQNLLLNDKMLEKFPFE